MNDGGPAFARPSVPIIEDQDRDFGQPGMSLRDYFAGQALCGSFAIMANPNFEAIGFEQMSEKAYAAADAMLKARKE